MSQIIVSRFEVIDLSIDALQILRAAVRHAYENQSVKTHTMRIDIFCHLAGLPSTPTERLLVLLKEVRKALVEIELIDTKLSERDDLPSVSWPVFNEIRIDSSRFIFFEVYSDTLTENIVAILPAPKRTRLVSERLYGKTASVDTYNELPISTPPGMQD